MSIAIELTRALPTAGDEGEGHLPVDALGVGVFVETLADGDLPAGLDKAFLDAQGFTAKQGSSCVVPGQDGRLLVALGLNPFCAGSL